ncbi:hypothetical protein [Aliidiomarina iranensis]|nr:hypothetical protein [Aliidiomarina iranensis]
MLEKESTDISIMNTETSLLRIKICVVITFAMLIICVLLMHALGLEHAFIKSIFLGEDLLTARFHNTHFANVPTHFRLMVLFLTSLLAILIGLYGRKLYSTSVIGLMLLVLLYSSSIYGAKGPIIKLIILYFIAFSTGNSKHFLKLFIAFFSISVVTAVLLFFVVRVQIPDLNLTSYFEYLLTRLGIGQVQGVYEQFGVQLRDFSYIFDEIPFSGFFTDPPEYSKDLMMATLGFSKEFEEIGVMNSFFVGKAFAIGGYFLVFVSPVIVAFNYCLIVSFVVCSFRKLLYLPKYSAQIISILFVSSVIAFTGDFNGLLFAKRIFLISFFFGITLIPAYLIAYLSYRNRLIKGVR